MTQQDKNKLISILKNYNNIAILLNELLTPTTQIQQQYNCTIEQAVNIKLKAENFLNKYGILTLNATTKAVQNIIEKIKTE